MGEPEATPGLKPVRFRLQGVPSCPLLDCIVRLYAKRLERKEPRGPEGCGWDKGPGHTALARGCRLRSIETPEKPDRAIFANLNNVAKIDDFSEWRVRGQSTGKGQLAR